MKHIYKV